MKKYRLAIVGATGVVGRTILKVLEEEDLPISEYVLFSSKKSAGKKINFFDKTYIVQGLNELSFDSGFDFAIFSAGSSTSIKYAPIASSKNCIVIDNSSVVNVGSIDSVDINKREKIRKAAEIVMDNIDYFVEGDFDKVRNPNIETDTMEEDNNVN